MESEPATGTQVPAFGSAGEVAAALAAATRAAFISAETREPNPHGRWLSTLGDCTRAAAYRLAGTEPSDVPDPEEKRPAWLGTWQHAGLLPLLAAQLPGADIEVPVTVTIAGVEFRGRIDLDWPGVAVFDLKTVGENKLARVRRDGRPYPAARLQVLAGALGKLQSGEPPEWVAWHYLDRASGEDYLIVEPFTNGGALEVIDRVRTLTSYAEDPDQAPRDERGPGLSFACDGCPWLRRCWGPDATPGRKGPQASLVRTREDVIQALLDYDDARGRASQAAKDKEYAAAKLDRSRYGVYGPLPDRPELAVKFFRSRDGEQLDQEAARALIEELGGEVPMQPKRGALRVRLVPMPPDDTPVG